MSQYFVFVGLPRSQTIDAGGDISEHGGIIQPREHYEGV